ncbi:carboxyl-terminal processing protease [Flexibacter flexilis DSM 6793]|uniref:Carboxyl-terminal processing protease n=1 Tax=Flexibacter flexilis DSM 6793 TaxID=927664 RepID=A0A1I1DH82_9BACT|nr:S41 family peptidase [Flexibacter flexilis]SFB72100.1 carboxyl-terminal processing protease [Flexibacter flexilis DSM 6793]
MNTRLKKWLIPSTIIGAAALTIAAGNPTEKYFEIAKNMDIFATLFKEVNTYYVDEVSPNKLMKTGIDAMLNSLDPYTNYIPEDEIEDYRTMTTGQYGGIGAIIGKRNNKTLVLMPYENFPAQKAGLRIGDEILEIDGVDAAKKNSNDVSKLLKGQAGTAVKLKVKRFGQKETMNIEITRQRIKIDNVPYYGMVNDEVGYLHLTDFTSDASKEVRKAVTELKEKGAKKIVFDLRDNPGGLLNEAVNIANLFVPKDKLVVSTKGKMTDWNKNYTALNPPLDVDIPVAILTSGRSASASEIVAGVMQDYDRGVLVGQRTFGKGLVQATRPLSYNSQLKITTAKYYIPSGRCIQAIDYSHKNEDGAASRIADSLRVAFKTSNGRVVYDGGGVTPDVDVERPNTAPITISLLNKGLLFDYATEYAAAHQSIVSAKKFKVSDAEYEHFMKWLSGKEYDYITKVETDLNDLTANAKKEKYYDDIKEQIDQLKKRVSHNKELDLVKNKEEIKEYLEQEIVSRYYYEKGVKEASFDNDVDLQAALKVLQSPTEYQNILKGKK